MNLLKDEVSTLVRKLAIPASIGTLFQTLYTIVDTFYAGKISPEALSALSKSFPIFLTQTEPFWALSGNPPLAPSSSRQKLSFCYRNKQTSTSSNLARERSKK